MCQVLPDMERGLEQAPHADTFDVKPVKMKPLTLLFAASILLAVGTSCTKLGEVLPFPTTYRVLSKPRTNTI